MQTNERKLESVTETVITIPFGGSDDESDFEDDVDEETSVFSCKMYTPPELASRDLPDGPRLRMKAYQDALNSCRGRIHEILRRIHTPTIKRVIDIVQESYEPAEEDRIMPFTELRAVAISGIDRSATQSILDEVRQLLVSSEVHEPGREELRLKRPVLVSTVTSTDCSNLTSAMRAIINGFLGSLSNGIDKGGEGESKRVFAPYDISFLANWYDKLSRSQDKEDRPKLVILVMDLEKIEPAIMQDVFYICSLHVPRLPLVFILGLSTPPTPSYMHSAFLRKTLALLQLTRIEAASGVEVLTRVLKDTFFHPEIEPTVMPSPTVLSFISEQYTRSVQSMDFVVSILRLVYLRHFTDPMSVLAHDELLGTTSIEEASEKLSSPAGRPFLRALLARLHRSDKTSNTSDYLVNGANKHDDSTAETSSRKSSSRLKGKGKANRFDQVDTDLASALGVLKRIREIRREHRDRMLRSRIAYMLISEIRNRLDEGRPTRSNLWDLGRRAEVIGTEIDTMCSWLRGTVNAKEKETLVQGIWDLLKVDDEYTHLPYALSIVLSGLPEEVISKEDSKIELLKSWDSRCNDLEYELDTEVKDDGWATIGIEMEEWLTSYISESTYDFTETELWDIWYTGHPTGVSELLNPAPRAAIINALVHPERYLGNKDASILENHASARGKEKRRADGADGGQLMPDTALLFKGYLESGRMMNIYDWYTSFKESLDARRRSEHRATEASSSARMRGKKYRQKAVKGSGEANTSAPPSPTKGRGRPRGRGTTGRGRGTRGGKTRAERPNSEPESDDGADENETGSDDDLNPDERERWESEVHARFIRSVQELDMLGFIKHTGRKADHVQKTVYELPDYA